MQYNRTMMMFRMMGMRLLMFAPVIGFIHLLGIKTDDKFKESLKEAKELTGILIDNSIKSTKNTEEKFITEIEKNKIAKEVIGDTSKITNEVLKQLDDKVLKIIQKEVGNVQVYLEYEIEKKLNELKKKDNLD